jgi:hypothetical protein
VQRRESRETNLSAEQIGAQAPARLSRPHGDQRRPQGSRGAARAWTQAPQCVIGTPVPPFPSSGSNAGAIFGPRRPVYGCPAALSCYRRARAVTKAPSASASPCRSRWATPSSVTACAADCGRWCACRWRRVVPECAPATTMCSSGGGRRLPLHSVRCCGISIRRSAASMPEVMLRCAGELVVPVLTPYMKRVRRPGRRSGAATESRSSRRPSQRKAGRKSAE